MGKPSQRKEVRVVSCRVAVGVCCGVKGRRVQKADSLTAFIIMVVTVTVQVRRRMFTWKDACLFSSLAYRRARCVLVCLLVLFVADA